MEMENVVSTSVKLAIAVASVQKYPNDDEELWQCVLGMLKKSLQSQVSDSKLLPMDPIEFSRLVSCLSRRRETDAELWALVVKVLVTLMNTKKLAV